MKINSIFIFLFLSFMTRINAQTVIPLWEGSPPTSNGLTEQEIATDGSVSGVSDPELIVYLPDKRINTHKAVIICPGGGYTHLAIDHEGHQFAQWLQLQGIAGIILKYRMPNGHKEIPLEDFQQAMRYVRSKAVEWNIVGDDMKSQIGVAGFSAGGHLASTASTHYSSTELRPDFSILFYPVITMGSYTHEGSRDNLLGENRTADDVLFYSNETRVDEQTPPAILLLSDDDKAVPSKNSILYYNALKDKGVSSTMYIFPEGNHGWGMRPGFKYHKEMLTLLKMWLEQL